MMTSASTVEPLTRVTVRPDREAISGSMWMSPDPRPWSGKGDRTCRWPKQLVDPRSRPRRLTLSRNESQGIRSHHRRADLGGPVAVNAYWLDLRDRRAPESGLVV